MRLRGVALAAGGGGVPSTVWAVLRRTDPLAATWAAGRLLAPRTADPRWLIASAIVVHAGFSIGWAGVLDRVLPAGPRPRRVLGGAVAGVVIAAGALGAARVLRGSPRFESIARLPVGPQVADHVAFGVIYGLSTCAR